MKGVKTYHQIICIHNIYLSMYKIGFDDIACRSCNSVPFFLQESLVSDELLQAGSNTSL